MIAFANPERILPLPSYLNIDSELAIRIIDMLDSNEKIQDLTNTNPTARINRMENAKYLSRTPPYSSNDRHNKFKNNQRNDRWADQLKWEVIKGAVCPGCKRNNHNVYKTGCPAFAQFAICQEFYDKCPPKELQKVKTSFTEYQKSRRNQMNERKRTDRATIRKFEAKGKHDQDDMAEVKLTFFEAYKEDFQEEQYLEENPFDTMGDESFESNDATVEIEV